MKHHQRRRHAAAAMLALSAVGVVGSAASAHQDPGPPAANAYFEYELRNPLTCVGRQYAHADNNAGNGVVAPLWLCGR
jgi:hypothetical protein